MGDQQYWRETSERPAYPRAEHATADVVVVGGGITGVATAWMLAKQGVQTVLVEAERIGAGDTGHTTAHLTCLLDASPNDLERALGKHASMLLEAHATAIDEIERIATEEQIACEFTRIDAYVFGLHEGDADSLRAQARRLERWGRECSYVSSAGATVASPGGAIRVPTQAKFHPLKFLGALARSAERSGARLFERSRVVHTEYSHGQWLVKTREGAVIRAHSLVLATHSPIGLVPVLQTRLEPYRTYAAAVRIPKDAIEEASYFDTAEPYNYTRVERRQDYDVAIVGGRDHRTGKVPGDHEPHEELCRYLWSTFAAEPQEILSRWSGEVFEPVDQVAYVGRIPGLHPNRYVATGFSGNGMTYGVLSAMLLRDLITGGQNAWADLLDPGRINAKASAGEFVKTNVEVAMDFIAGRLSPGERSRLSEVKPGTGRIVEFGSSKRAVYRKPDGALTVLSAKCTHMGCMVSWNATAGAWECSCHGSRFAPTGEVESGPAMDSLQVIHEEKDKQ